jgi:hypothetical protein
LTGRESCGGYNVAAFGLAVVRRSSRLAVRSLRRLRRHLPLQGRMKYGEHCSSGRAPDRRRVRPDLRVRSRYGPPGEAMNTPPASSCLWARSPAQQSQQARSVLDQAVLVEAS